MAKAKYQKMKMAKTTSRAPAGWREKAEKAGHPKAKKVRRLEDMHKRMTQLEKMSKSDLLKTYEKYYKEKHSSKSKKALIQGILRYEGYYNR